MNHIANIVTVGAPNSLARFHAAQTNAGVPVCGPCLKAHGKTIGVIISIGTEECYVCENAADPAYLILK